MLLGRAILRESRRLTRLRTTLKQPIPPRLTRSTSAKRASHGEVSQLSTLVCRHRRRALEADASLGGQNTARQIRLRCCCFGRRASALAHDTITTASP